MLTGKTAVITGASAGIGEAAAKRLAGLGMRVVLTARRAEKLDALVAELARAGHDAHAYSLDVRDKNAVAAFAAWLEAQGPSWRPRVLLNNAGLAQGLNSLQDGLLEDWDTMIDTNVKGLLYMTRALLPMMIAADEGHIVNVGSIAGLAAYPNGNVYCATKAAVRMLNAALNVDLVGTSIRSTLLAPGMAETEFSLVRFKGDAARAQGVYDGLEPLTADHLADIIAWVVSQPQPVAIQEILVTPTAQRNAYVVHRR